MNRNRQLTDVMMLAAFLTAALSLPLQAALVVTEGGFDQEVKNTGLPGGTFESPLGTHIYSSAHNTAWTASGNNMWTAGVGAPNTDPPYPSGSGPSAPTSPPYVAWHNSSTRGTQTQTLGGTMDADRMYTLSFDVAIASYGSPLPDMSHYDLTAVVVGSVDGELARRDFAEDITSVDTWHRFSLSWFSTGLDLNQTVTIAIGASDDGSGNVMFVTDSVSIEESGMPLTLVAGGFDQEPRTTGLPANPFTSPLGSHSYSIHHNLAWTASGNQMWAAGVGAPNTDPPYPPGAGPNAPTSPPYVAWLNSGNNTADSNGTQTQTLGGRMEPHTRYMLSFDAAIASYGNTRPRKA